MANLFKANQYVSTTLATAGGIDDSQTTDIELQSVTGIDTAEPGICCISYSSPVDTDNAEWVTYTSINSGTKKLEGVTRGAEGFSAKSHAYGVTVAFPISESHINNLVDALSIGGDSTDGVTTTLDEDDMASNSATALATQQSIRGFGGFLIDGNYARDVRFQAKDVSVAADRYTLVSPNRMVVYIGSKGYLLTSQIELDLSNSDTWDTISGTDYTTASNRNGKDFYIYACIPTSGNTPDLLVSADASTPDGYTTADSLKIGGFHTLCESVGTISGHTLTGYVQGDILPQSVWDLKHRPVSDPEGMVYDPKMKKWVDIYLASVSSGKLVSVNGGTIADGASTEAFHWYKFVQWFNEVGKKLPDQSEFHSFSMGANQGTNITGSADPVTTGGHTDTAGRRMISDIGCEDTCGVLSQWSRDRGSDTTASSWVDAYDANDSDVAGQHYQAPNCARFGGGWNYGAICGSRCSSWSDGPLILGAGGGARGVAEPV